MSSGFTKYLSLITHILVILFVSSRRFPNFGSNLPLCDVSSTSPKRNHRSTFFSVILSYLGGLKPYVPNMSKRELIARYNDVKITFLWDIFVYLQLVYRFAWKVIQPRWGPIPQWHLSVSRYLWYFLSGRNTELNRESLTLFRRHKTFVILIWLTQDDFTCPTGSSRLESVKILQQVKGKSIMATTSLQPYSKMHVITFKFKYVWTWNRRGT